MQIKSIVAGAAIALAATVGSAFAADQFTTLEGVLAQPMNAAVMDEVRGTAITLDITTGHPAGSAFIEALNNVLAVNTAPAPTRTVP